MVSSKRGLLVPPCLEIILECKRRWKAHKPIQSACMW